MNTQLFYSDLSFAFCALGLSLFDVSKPFFEAEIESFEKKSCCFICSGHSLIPIFKACRTVLDSEPRFPRITYPIQKPSGLSQEKQSLPSSRAKWPWKCVNFQKLKQIITDIRAQNCQKFHYLGALIVATRFSTLLLFFHQPIWFIQISFGWQKCILCLLSLQPSSLIWNVN